LWLIEAAQNLTDLDDMKKLVCRACCLFPELNDQFEDMLTRNKDAVDEAKKNLDAQTSQRPMDTN